MTRQETQVCHEVHIHGFYSPLHCPRVALVSDQKPKNMTLQVLEQVGASEIKFWAQFGCLIQDILTNPTFLG